jgi:hypothetical protein
MQPKTYSQLAQSLLHDQVPRKDATIFELVDKEGIQHTSASLTTVLIAVLLPFLPYLFEAPWAWELTIRKCATASASASAPAGVPIPVSLCVACNGNSATFDTPRHGTSIFLAQVLPFLLVPFWAWLAADVVMGHARAMHLLPYGIVLRQEKGTRWIIACGLVALSAAIPVLDTGFRAKEAQTVTFGPCIIPNPAAAPPSSSPSNGTASTVFETLSPDSDGVFAASTVVIMFHRLTTVIAMYAGALVLLRQRLSGPGLACCAEVTLGDVVRRPRAAKALSATAWQAVSETVLDRAAVELFDRRHSGTTGGDGFRGVWGRTLAKYLLPRALVPGVVEELVRSGKLGTVSLCLSVSLYLYLSLSLCISVSLPLSLSLSFSLYLSLSLSLSVCPLSLSLCLPSTNTQGD